jgi:Flp pilus assembly pilin Flp
MNRPIEISTRVFHRLSAAPRAKGESVYEYAFLGALMTIVLIGAVTATAQRLYGAYGPHSSSFSSLGSGWGGDNAD